MEAQRNQVLLILSVLVCLSHTASSTQEDDLSFLVIGDWGGLNFFPYRTPIESAVSKQMGKTAEELSAKFVIALGKLKSIHNFGLHACFF